jgi:predicted RNase H-like HicB family nuclease
MKTAIVILEKSDGNYSAYLPNLNGCVATGTTLQEVKGNIADALEFHIDGMKNENLEIPEPFNGPYHLTYKMDIESLFDWFSGVLTKSGLSRLTGMNQSLLSQYASGIKTPGPKQAKRIEKAIHSFGEELLKIQF